MRKITIIIFCSIFLLLGMAIATDVLDTPIISEISILEHKCINTDNGQGCHVIFTSNRTNDYTLMYYYPTIGEDTLIAQIKEVEASKYQSMQEQQEIALNYDLNNEKIEVR